MPVKVCAHKQNWDMTKQDWINNNAISSESIHWQVNVYCYKVLSVFTCMYKFPLL